MNSIISISILCILLYSCKSESDIFPINVLDISSIKLSPIKEKSFPPFDVAKMINDRKDIVEIVKLINAKTKYRHGISKLNQNKFFLDLHFLDDSLLKIPIGYNKKLKVTRTKLYSHKNGGYHIGNYEMNGLYEFLTRVMRRENN